MKGGFTFCGVDINDIGLDYAPELEDTFVYSPSKTIVHEETIDTHDGGYYYGMTKEPKEFTLRCYFEQKEINRDVMAQVNALFRRGRSGKLIFQKRPWCYYYATVIDIEHEFTNYLNGLITVTMKAQYPLGRSDTLYSPLGTPDHEVIMSNTAMFEKESMIPPLEFTNVTEELSLIIPNPGTEYAPLGIYIAGDAGDGVSIINQTTNQECRVVAMSKTVTSNRNQHVFIDGLNGKTILAGESMSQVAFLYHDKGFISLEPGYPALRKIYASCDNTETVTVSNIISEDVVGKYIYLNEWIKIESQSDKHTLVLEKSGGLISPTRTMIMSMNEILVTPDTTMDLTSLKFVFKPTFA